MTDEYTATVTFTRSRAEDEETATTNFPDLPLEEALRRQLALELQEACDNGMAGNFEVDPIDLPD